VIEGHAELVATAALMHARGRELAGLSPEELALSGAGRLTAGDWILIYGLGLRAALAQQQRGGWPAVAASLRSLPPSSEQLLHATKRGVDRPTHVAPPDVPGATLRRHTVVGEMSILLQSVGNGIADDTATLAASGWDGDRLAIYDLAGEPLVIWRSVWDRPVDAEQFEQLLAGLGSRSASAWIGRQGHGVDVVMSSTPAHMEEAERIGRALPPLPRPPAADGERTAADERNIVARANIRARIDGQHVTFPVGVRLPMPATWSLFRVKALDLVRGPMLDGFADNVLTDVKYDLFGRDLDELETEWREQVANTPTIELLDVQRRTIGGRPVVWLEMRGRWSGQAHDLHQWVVVTIHRDHIVTIVGTSAAARATTSGPVLLRTLEAIEWIEP